MAPNVMFAMVVVVVMFVTQSDAACDDSDCPVLDCVDPGTNPYDPCCQRCPNGKCGVKIIILGRKLGPSGVSPNQRSRWKHAFSPLKHV